MKMLMKAIAANAGVQALIACWRGVVVGRRMSVCLPMAGGCWGSASGGRMPQADGARCPGGNNRGRGNSLAEPEPCSHRNSPAAASRLLLVSPAAVRNEVSDGAAGFYRQLPTPEEI